MSESVVRVGDATSARLFMQGGRRGKSQLELAINFKNGEKITIGYSDRLWQSSFKNPIVKGLYRRLKRMEVIESFDDYRDKRVLESRDYRELIKDN